MTTTTLNDAFAHQQSAFTARCQRDGLHPDGFDVRFDTTETPGLVRVVVNVGKRTYRYVGTSSDTSWVDRFFDDIQKVGDPGNNV